ncbi:hypothetical protein [Aquipseudomonas alcaligenes]|uniref:Lipoprotein n=1 Tax=Aquipseudomonas alcaligenes TaxID=43263 RepID=A0AB73HX90_AQUAC|nr:hypothetical protein [Pseudomonas alcaligenes]MDH0142397.1 hypothetical protein [Pseudomonas alcaligenes]
MKRNAAIIFFALAIYGCNDESKIQDSVRSKLKYPESAKFENIFLSKDGTRACIKWNAKNSFGGYGEWSTAELKNNEGTWIVENMQGYDFNCSDEATTLNERVESAKKEALQKAFSLIQKSRNLSDEQMSLTNMPRDCRAIAYTYARTVESVVRAKHNGAGIEQAEAREAKIRNKLQKGNCSSS